jgi:hypothetical protein
MWINYNQTHVHVDYELEMWMTYNLDWLLNVSLANRHEIYTVL